MKKFSFFALVLTMFCGPVFADNVDVDIKLCTIPSHSDNPVGGLKFISHVSCYMENGEEIFGEVNSEKIQITGIDVYDNPVNADRIKKGTVTGLKKLKEVRIASGLTASDMHANTGKFCKTYIIKGAVPCHISSMVFQIKMGKDVANSSFYIYPASQVYKKEDLKKYKF